MDKMQYRHQRLKALREMTLDELKVEWQKLRAQRQAPAQKYSTTKKVKKKSGLDLILSKLPADKVAELRKIGVV
jgi:hypothetical protein